MAFQGPSVSFSSPSSDRADGGHGTGSSPYTTGCASAGSRSHHHGSLAAHYYHTHGVTSAGPAVGAATPAAMVTGSLTTATDKAAQRQHIIDHVNAFLARYEMTGVVTDVQQCSSSLFVILYQRFFNCTIQGIEQPPNTPEKKRRNLQLVLEGLERQGYGVHNVEADEVVRLNEDHISRLVMVFVRIAEDMQRQEQLESMANTHGASSGGPVNAHAAAPSTSMAGYAPYGGEAGLGYTVAEVARRPRGPSHDAADRFGYDHAHHHDPHSITTGNHNYDHDSVKGGGAGLYPHLLAGEQGYALDPHDQPHHLSGTHHNTHHVAGAGAATGSFHEDDCADEEEENRSGIGSYVVDTSVMPTDKLLEEWYRDLETPALGEGSLNLSYPTTELRSSPGSWRGDSGETPTGPRHSRQRPGTYTDALNTSDIRQRHRLLNETLDRMDARHRAAGGPLPLPAHAQGRPCTGHDDPITAPTLTTSTTSLDSYQSGIGTSSEKRPGTRADHSPAQRTDARRPVHREPARRRRSPALPLEEPPLTRAESRLLASHPYRQIDAEYRDRKIERLRAARFLASSQDLIRQRMRRQHDETMAQMRQHMKTSLATSKSERFDRMRQVRDENERYRQAYETLMASAANGVRVPRYMMSRHTAELAKYFADSLHESHRMCEYLETERARRNRADVMRYAESVTAWQRQAYV